MLCIRPGDHGSTFGGNRLASAVAIAALEVVEEEKLSERAPELGQEFRKQFFDVQKAFTNTIKEVRARGLLNAVELDLQGLSSISAFDLCVQLKERGILAKLTHDTTIRLSPPLTISSEDLGEASKALKNVLEYDFPELQQQSQGTISQKALESCDRCGHILEANAK